ncbi:MAG: thiol:disulfide interchange protein DsbA/DsbL [Proteobacteria bacterium]|nr:thiol:disulfide interchange protein DsbA/DsbL [Pseudomonadota bacterium]
MIRLLQLLGFALLTFNMACAEEETPPPETDGEQRVIEEGRDFSRVLPVQPTSVAPGQVEVLEFFWYGCPHCYRAEAAIEQWRENLPEGVVFRRIPATLSRGWVTMSQAYYTAEVLGVLENMHPAFFAAFHENGTMLASEDQLAAYFKEHAGVEEAAFREAFNSIQVSSRVQRADALSRRYRIGGVPAMTVNGKYITNPEMARGYEKMVDTVELLARWELKAQDD